MHLGIYCVYVYHWQILLNIGKQSSGGINNGLRDELRDLGLLREPSPVVLLEAAGRKRGCRKRCARLRKRGKRAGIRTKLKANPSRPALPYILLSNIRSLDNKTDLLQLQLTSQREIRNCCVFNGTDVERKLPPPILTSSWDDRERPDQLVSLCGTGTAQPLTARLYSGEKIIGISLPSIDASFNNRCLRRAYIIFLFLYICVYLFFVLFVYLHLCSLAKCSVLYHGTE